MKCAWCQKRVWWWQSKKPLGGGFLLDTFGQSEHTACQAIRFKNPSIAKRVAARREARDTILD